MLSSTTLFNRGTPPPLRLARWPTHTIPRHLSFIASSPLSEQISKEMKRRGFKFVGPTIVYAWMQAVGIVNDHALGCFKRSK